MLFVKWRSGWGCVLKGRNKGLHSYKSLPLPATLSHFRLCTKRKACTIILHTHTNWTWPFWQGPSMIYLFLAHNILIHFLEFSLFYYKSYVNFYNISVHAFLLIVIHNFFFSILTTLFTQKVVSVGFIKNIYIINAYYNTYLMF